MIKGAILDIDGTILDSMQFWEKAPGPFLNSVGIELEPEIAKATLFKSISEIADLLKSEYDLDTSEEAIMKYIACTVENFYVHRVRLKPGAGQFLENMKKAGIKMTAATFSNRQNVEYALKRLDVLKFFDSVFTCAEIGAGKDKPDIYLAAAAHMGTLPKHTWVFEDALYAIHTAKNAGFKTVGVYDESSREYQDEIKNTCDVYVEKLDDFNISYQTLK